MTAMPSGLVADSLVELGDHLVGIPVRPLVGDGRPERRLCGLGAVSRRRSRSRRPASRPGRTRSSCPGRTGRAGQPAAPLAPALGLAAVLQAPTTKTKTVAPPPLASLEPGTIRERVDRLMTTSSLAVPASLPWPAHGRSRPESRIARSVRIDVDRCQRLRSKEFALRTIAGASARNRMTATRCQAARMGVEDVREAEPQVVDEREPAAAERPQDGPDDARHRGRGRRVAEHGVAGPERRPDARPDRAGDAGARRRHRPQAGLPAELPRPRPARRLDDAARRGRPRHHRPVLRGRHRGAVDRGDEPRLQRRPRPRPRPGRRGARADRGPRDAPLRRDRPASATSRTSHDCSRDLADSLVPVVALWQGSSPLGVPTVDVDNDAGIRRGLDHLDRAWAIERIAFVQRPAARRHPRARGGVQRLHGRRFGGVRDGYVQHVPNTPGGGEAAIRALLALPEPPTGGRDLDRTRSPSARSTPPTAMAPLGSDATCRSSASTTSCSRATRCPPLTTLRMPTADDRRGGRPARDRVRRATPPPSRTGGRHRDDRADADRPPVDCPAVQPGSTGS